ncbi:MAG: alanine racemase [Planctomycetota bacterium]
MSGLSSGGLSSGGWSDPATTGGEARALISRAALLHNAQLLAEEATPARLCPVVKADAYGHGAPIVADALCRLCKSDGPQRPAASMLAVVTIDEAAEIDAVLGGIGVPLLVLRPVSNTYAGRNRKLLEHAIRRGFILSLLDGGGVDDTARAAARVGARANVHVGLDTGMSRESTDRRLFPELIAKVRATPQLKLHSVSTHFSDADVEDEPLTQIQAEAFADATEDLSDQGVLRHASNSGGTFFCHRGVFDFVRPGIALYGIDPGGKPDVRRNLRPVMRLVAPLAHIREIAAGVSVGYGRTWTAQRPSKIGLLPLGYADGVPRLAGRRAAVRIGPRDRPVYCPVVGTISMDYVTIDLTDAPHVGLGESVTVIDDDPLSPASVYAWAKHARTIPYEILTGIGRRVHRVPTDPADIEIDDADAAEEAD